MGRCLSGICGSYPPEEPIVGSKGLALDTKRNIHHCIILLGIDGTVGYYDRNNSDVLVAQINPMFEYSDVEIKEGPPYYQILPCPYCGVLTDKEHDPMLHVDKKLGVSNATT